MPTIPLQTIITTANTVSRANAALSGPPPSITNTISDTSITVTATARTSVPNGSPTLCAIISAWNTAANTLEIRAIPAKVAKIALGVTTSVIARVSKSKASRGEAHVHQGIRVLLIMREVSRGEDSKHTQTIRGGLVPRQGSYSHDRLLASRQSGDSSPPSGGSGGLGTCQLLKSDAYGSKFCDETRIRHRTRPGFRGVGPGKCSIRGVARVRHKRGGLTHRHERWGRGKNACRWARGGHCGGARTAVFYRTAAIRPDGGARRRARRRWS